MDKVRFETGLRIDTDVMDELQDLLDGNLSKVLDFIVEIYGVIYEDGDEFEVYDAATGEIGVKAGKALLSSEKYVASSETKLVAVPDDSVTYNVILKHSPLASGDATYFPGYTSYNLKLLDDFDIEITTDSPESDETLLATATRTGATITVVDMRTWLKLADDIIPDHHEQNTDTGTSSSTFSIDGKSALVDEGTPEAPTDVTLSSGIDTSLLPSSGVSTKYDKDFRTGWLKVSWTPMGSPDGYEVTITPIDPGTSNPLPGQAITRRIGETETSAIFRGLTCGSEWQASVKAFNIPDSLSSTASSSSNEIVGFSSGAAPAMSAITLTAYEFGFLISVAAPADPGSFGGFGGFEFVFTNDGLTDPDFSAADHFHLSSVHRKIRVETGPSEHIKLKGRWYNKSGQVSQESAVEEVTTGGASMKQDTRPMSMIVDIATDQAGANEGRVIHKFTAPTNLILRGVEFYCQSIDLNGATTAKIRVYQGGYLSDNIAVDFDDVGLHKTFVDFENGRDVTAGGEVIIEGWDGSADPGNKPGFTGTVTVRYQLKDTD